MTDKTHCDQGHPYDDENTYITDKGVRCRACDAERLRRYYESKAAFWTHLADSE